MGSVYIWTTLRGFHTVCFTDLRDPFCVLPPEPLLDDHPNVVDEHRNVAGQVSYVAPSAWWDTLHYSETRPSSSVFVEAQVSQNHTFRLMGVAETVKGDGNIPNRTNPTLVPYLI